MTKEENVLLMRLRGALYAFAKMDRENCDLEAMVCKRGTASDATYLFNDNFREAAQALREFDEYIKRKRARKVKTDRQASILWKKMWSEHEKNLIN